MWRDLHLANSLWEVLPRSCPQTCTLPEVGLSRPAIKLSNVDLIKKIGQFDQLEEEDKKAIERLLDLALFKHSVKKNLQKS